MSTHRQLTDRADAVVHRWLVAHSLTLLRVSLGVIFLAFGALKYIPGASPAQNLVQKTTDVLTVGLVPGSVAIVAIATLECTIGLWLLTGRGMRLAVYLLAAQMVGILAPIVFFPGRLFAGPGHAPTLEGQYVLKDIILATATMVIATTLRGGRLTRGDRSAVPVHSDVLGRAVTAEEKLAVVIAGIRGDVSVERICGAHGISPADYERWHAELIDGASAALASTADPPPPA